MDNNQKNEEIILEFYEVEELPFTGKQEIKLINIFC